MSPSLSVKMAAVFMARNFDPKAPPEPLEERVPSAGTMVKHFYQGLFFSLVFGPATVARTATQLQLR